MIESGLEGVEFVVERPGGADFRAGVLVVDEGAGNVSVPAVGREGTGDALGCRRCAAIEVVLVVVLHPIVAHAERQAKFLDGRQLDMHVRRDAGECHVVIVDLHRRYRSIQGVGRAAFRIGRLQ